MRPFPLIPDDELICFQSLTPADSGKNIYVIAELPAGTDEDGNFLEERALYQLPGIIMSVQSPVLALVHFNAGVVDRYELATELPGGGLILRVPIKYLRFRQAPAVKK